MIVLFYQKDTWSQEEATVDKIGRGVTLNPLFDAGMMTTNGGVERINQSLNIIINTPRGSRFFNPLFGSKLYLLLYQQDDSVFKEMAEFYIREAIELWEKRIIIQSIYVDITKIRYSPITIKYSFKDTSMEYTFTYILERFVV